MTRHLYIVRHGETVHNVARLTQGWGDSDLSDLGKVQVQRLARRLAGLKPTALYASPLGRAMSTAQAISEETGLKVTPHDGLREMNYGRWEGRAFLDIRTDDEELYRRWISDEDCPSPGGESHAEVRLRFMAALAEMNSERAIAVAHGTAIRIGATGLLGLPIMSALRFAQDNAALNVFAQRGDGQWILKAWNDATHTGSDER